MNNAFEIRFANENDVNTIYNFICNLAEYENMLGDVIATPELLKEWIFEKGKAEVILAVADGKEVGFALFFHNFSTFLGRAGIYLEDLLCSLNTEATVTAKHYSKSLPKLQLKEVAEGLNGVALTGTNRALTSIYRSVQRRWMNGLFTALQAISSKNLPNNKQRQDGYPPCLFFV